MEGDLTFHICPGLLSSQKPHMIRMLCADAITFPFCQSMEVHHALQCFFFLLQNEELMYFMSIFQNKFAKKGSDRINTGRIRHRQLLKVW